MNNALVHAFADVVSTGITRVDCNGLTHLSECIPVCATGYFLSGQPATLTCLGSFIGGAMCTRYQCSGVPAVVLPASVASGCAGKYHGEVCPILCPSGHMNNFVNVADEHFSCQFGVWQRDSGGQSVQCAPAPCQQGPFVHLGASGNASCEQVPHGSTCLPGCIEKHMFGASDPNCYRGSWNISQSCMPTGGTTFVGGTTRRQVVLPAIALVLSIELGDSDSSQDPSLSAFFGYDWARTNAGAITQALASSVATDRSQLRVDVVPASSAEPQPETMPTLTLVKVVILLDADSTLSDSEVLRVTNALSGSTGRHLAAGGFLQTLLAILETNSGMKVPLRLMHAMITFVQPPYFIPAFNTMEATWVVSAYGACQNGCGTGRQTRNVTCPSGPDTCVHAVPPSTDSCVNYDGCGFEVFCPLGRGSGSEENPFGCVYQSVLLSILLLFVLAWFGFIFYKKVKSRQPAMACHHVEKSNASTGFQHIEGLGLTRVTVTYPEPSARSDPELGGQEKIHVIWEPDPDALQAYFLQSNPHRQEQIEGHESNDRSEVGRDEAHVEALAQSKEPGGQAEGPSQLAEAIEEPVVPVQPDRKDPQLAGGETSAMHPALPPCEHNQYVPCNEQVFSSVCPVHLPTPETVFRPMYGYGCKLEYYSSNSSKWKVASVVKAVEADLISTDMPMHDILVLGADRARRPWQEINCVPPDKLRPPLEGNELVEVFADRPSGPTWLLAKMYGDEPQPTHAARTGYKVILLESGAVLDAIPASRLRRRFPAQLPIWVFRGPEVGWVASEVHADADKHGRHAEEMYGLHGGEARWVHVPLQCADGAEIEKVPSFMCLTFNPTRVVGGRILGSL